MKAKTGMSGLGAVAVLVLQMFASELYAADDLSQANAYFAQRDYQKALIHYHKELNNNAGSSEAYAGLAKAYYRLGRHDRERYYYNTLLQADPQHPEALLYRCKHLISEKRYDEAEEILLGLTEVAEIKGRVLHHLAMLYVSTGRANEADAIYSDDE